MDEKALCEFVERWNGGIEMDSFPGSFPLRYSDNIRVIYMLDDLMATFDATFDGCPFRHITQSMMPICAREDPNVPQWVEASAVGPDGVTYWARVDSRGWTVPRNAQIIAQSRANYLASQRWAAERGDG